MLITAIELWWYFIRPLHSIAITVFITNILATFLGLRKALAGLQPCPNLINLCTNISYKMKMFTEILVFQMDLKLCLWRCCNFTKIVFADFKIWKSGGQVKSSAWERGGYTAECGVRDCTGEEGCWAGKMHCRGKDGKFVSSERTIER